MRFGCCINMIATGDDKIGAEHVELLAAAGYDYLEMPLAEMVQLPDDAFETLVRRIGASGLKCEACNNLFPARIRLTGAQAKPDEAREYLKKALARAARIGAQVVVFGSGGAKRIPEGFDLEKGYEQVVDMTGMVCTMAAQYGITIAIEPLRKPECNVINTFEQGVDLARRVGMENCKVLVDFYHLTYEQESPSVLERWGKEFLVHIHFANPAIGTSEERGFPNSPQEWPYEAFVSALQAIPYTGRISVEAYCSNSLDVQAPVTLRTMKKIFEGGNLQ